MGNEHEKISVRTTMDTAVTRRCDDLARAAPKLVTSLAHDALIMGRPKLMQTTRDSCC